MVASLISSISSAGKFLASSTVLSPTLTVSWNNFVTKNPPRRVTMAFAQSTNGNIENNQNNLFSQLLNELRNDRSKIVLLDGGTGEELVVQGLPDDRQIWSAKAVVDTQYHALLQRVHQSFATAGARILTTNSYGIVPGVGFSPQDIPRHCAAAARLARESLHPPHPPTTTTPTPFLLGSLGPLVESYRPDLILPHSQGVTTYSTMIQAMAPYVDGFLAETMSSVEETMQAVEALARCRANAVIPATMMVSFTLQSNGNLRSGETVERAIERIRSFATTQQVDVVAILFNCCEPEAITRALTSLQDKPCIQDLILGASANRLTPVDADWTLATSETAQPLRDDLSPQRYGDEFVARWKNQLGVQLVGGCCGMTPTHIAYLRDHVC